MHQDIYKKLIMVAKAKDITNYTAIGKMIGLNMENPADRNKISTILDEINQYEHQHKRPMLSAVVIRRDINMPGDGFFVCARQLGRSCENNDVSFWAHELTEVHNYWQST